MFYIVSTFLILKAITSIISRIY